jgi:hypothetical protein
MSEYQQKESTMTEFNKRYSNAHKSALTMVQRHVGLAKSAHRRGLSSLAECAKVLVESTKLGKAAESDRLARHLTAANGHFGKAADHMDDASAHLSQAMTGFSVDQVPLLQERGYSRNVKDEDAPIIPSLSAAIIPRLSDLTEGDVPQYDSVAPYGEKIAAATAFAKMMTGEAPGRHVITTPRWRQGRFT